MKSKIYVHNLAHIQDARLIEHNKSELLRLLGPVLRRKKYAGLFSVTYSRSEDCLYEVVFTIKDTIEGTYMLEKSWALRPEQSGFIRDMTTAAQRIKSSWMTTFLLETPSFLPVQSDHFPGVHIIDSNEIKFKILQFVPHGS